MMFAAQLLKMAALASAEGLAVSNWLHPQNAALSGVVLFYLLLVRVS